MAFKAVLFDLDGTLLPMDQNVFVKTYFKGLAKALAVHGYDSKELVDVVWQGTEAMIHNNGNATNETVFWTHFCNHYGEQAKADIIHFERFYQTGFDNVQSVCSDHPMAKKIIEYLKEQGVVTVLATNPIFPSVATEKRIQWAGLLPKDFALYTTYENCRYSKPDLRYYQDILEQLGLAAEECLMVGNDVADDMVVTELGMKAFLLTDCLINHNNEDVSAYPSGSWDELFTFLKHHYQTTI